MISAVLLEEMEQDYFRYQCEETPLLSYQFDFMQNIRQAAI